MYFFAWITPNFFFHAGASFCILCPIGFGSGEIVATMTLYHNYAYMLDLNAGSQGNSSSVFCQLSASIETIIIIVTLPMTRTAFVANQDKYVASVARTAVVNTESVQILSIDEVSTRSSRIITSRLLLATSVRVQTSVMISMGQQSNLRDQSLLNSYLNENGLPSCTLLVQSSSNSILNVATPAPLPGESGSASSSYMPLGAIVGGTVGFMLFIAVTFLALRFRTKYAA